jgi:hypothetical protein
MKILFGNRLRDWGIVTLVACLATVLAAGRLAGQEVKPAGDNAMAQKVVGTWMFGANPENGYLFSWRASRTYSADGSFCTRIGYGERLVTYQGTWQVKGRAVLMTVTNALGTGNYGAEAPDGTVNSLKIVELDDHQLIYETEGHTNTLSR